MRAMAARPRFLLKISGLQRMKSSITLWVDCLSALHPEGEIIRSAPMFWKENAVSEPQERKNYDVHGSH